MTYSILVTPNYYYGTCGAPQEGYLKQSDLVDNPQHDDFYPVSFATREEAQEMIDGLCSGTYYLAHGEAGRPSYKIIDDDEGDDMPDCIDASSENFPGFELVDIDLLPDDVRASLEGASVDFSAPGDSYDIYTETAEDAAGKKYMVAFCPRTAAIELCDGDLGGLNWDKEAYFREIW